MSLVIASDARFGATDYTNDQIWELKIEGGEPSGLALSTTYGLRAQAMRIFPQFTDAGLKVIDPADFYQAPIINIIYSNYIRLSFSPFQDIDVIAEYWVPNSDLVAGRFSIVNSGDINREVDFALLCFLSPKDGQPMAMRNIEAAPVLVGQTDNIVPLIFLTGGPQPGKGSYPSLSIKLNLSSEETRCLIWAHAAADNAENSFIKARELAKCDWDAEIAVIDMVNSSLIDIYTGDPNWDIALTLSQKQAYSLIVGPTTNLPNPSFVFSRLPDDGYSLCGDGSDYDYLWNGQSPLEAYLLANILLPGGKEIADWIFVNYLSIQKENGFIDWKPGLAGQRSHMLATPILASLAWKLYEYNQNIPFLREIFPALHNFINVWFSSERDIDGDGVPEWDHLLQTGHDDHPIYSSWSEWSLGANISAAESPALCAYLYRECHKLIQIAEILEYFDIAVILKEKADKLHTHLESFWKSDKNLYLDRDRDTHITTVNEYIISFDGSGICPINRDFEIPTRILIRLKSGDEGTPNPDIFIHGISASGKGRIEHITGKEFKWHLGIGSFTGERIFTNIDRIEIRGLSSEYQIDIYALGFECINLDSFIPLWASATNEDRARLLVENNLMNPDSFWRPFGLPSCIDPFGEQNDEVVNGSNVVHTSLILEALLNYGHRDAAAELFGNLIAAIIKSLKKDKAFRRYYHANTGEGIGERNAISGLAPVDLFLEILGIKILSPKKILLEDYNPFPWPISVKYRGLTILRQTKKTTIIFPDGKTINVDGIESKLITLD